jgi:two-component sensor histidine kinase
VDTGYDGGHGGIRREPCLRRHLSIHHRRHDPSRLYHKTLASEAEHRSKNLLAKVQATVHLSRSETSEGLKQAIEGRIQALANVHSLFVETRWIGTEGVRKIAKR